MTETPEPTTVLATLDHAGLRYGLYRTTTDQSAIVSCVEAGGAVRRQTILKAAVLEVKTGLLRLEEAGLVAVVEGLHTRTGRPAYGYVYTLSLEGRLLAQDYHFKPDQLLAVLEHEGLRYEFSDTRGTFAGILICRGADGVVRWRRKLETSEIGLEEAKLNLDAGQLTVDAFGAHSRGGEWGRYGFRVTLGGTLTRCDPLQFPK